MWRTDLELLELFPDVAITLVQDLADRSKPELV